MRVEGFSAGGDILGRSSRIDCLLGFLGGKRNCADREQYLESHPLSSRELTPLYISDIHLRLSNPRWAVRCQLMGLFRASLVYRHENMIVAAAMYPEAPIALADEVSRLRRGDPDALAAAIARYQHRLYRYLQRFVGDASEAEDLFQQTWLRVLENLRRYDARRSFEAWLFSIAHNLAVDNLRRRRRLSTARRSEEHTSEPQSRFGSSY